MKSKVLNKIITAPRRLMIMPIKFYRKYLSPLKRSGCCRFMPTCSEYAMEAISEWGCVIGLFLSLFRLLRCNPLFKGGYDPVPVRKKHRGSEDPKQER